jgi:excisionase family DNA binding protein
MTVPTLPGVFTMSQAAEKAQVSAWTIRKEIRDGRLKARRIGSCVRVLQDELDRWLHDYEAQEAKAS